MSERTILNLENPVSQSADAVKALLAYMHRPSEPLPEFVELDNRVRLVLSKDKQAYYCVPANFYHPEKPCKHMKALQVAIEAREDDSILPAMAKPFRPYVDDGPVKVRTASGG
ncbi:MAG TPA: hypothetical protein PKX17_03990, partial [Candidatus Methanomethylicus sp.]|nr:hypothetical protein [Candidatus Methanomethylicus sp.]